MAVCGCLAGNSCTLRCDACVQVRERHSCGRAWRALVALQRSRMVPRGPNGCKTGRNSSCMQQFARYVCVKMLEFITASSLLWPHKLQECRIALPYRTTGT